MPVDAGPDTGPAPAPERRALFWTLSAYFGEGLPWSFLHQMATEYLTASGASKAQIGATSLFHLAVTLKFVWSPVVDLFGEKRRWLVLTQLVLAGGMWITALTVHAQSSRAFWLVLALLSVVHATHDIACDGFYLAALDRRQQALFSGVRNAGFRAATIVGSSALVYLAGRTNWELAFASAGVVMLMVALLNARLLPHRVQRRKPDAPPAAAFWAAYRTFFTQPAAGRVLAFMLLYRLGDIMMFSMSKPLLKDIGIDTAERGLLNGAGILASVLGSLAGGALIARQGLARCLVPLTYVQSLAIPLYVVLAVVQPGSLGVLTIVVAEQLAAGVGAAASAVFLMQRTSRAFSASHFAFATAVVSIGSSVSGYISGPLNEALGHPLFFCLAFVASWPSLVLVHRVPKQPLSLRIGPDSSIG